MSRVSESMAARRRASGVWEENALARLIQAEVTGAEEKRARKGEGTRVVVVQFVVGSEGPRRATSSTCGGVAAS